MTAVFKRLTALVENGDCEAVDLVPLVAMLPVSHLARTFEYLRKTVSASERLDAELRKLLGEEASS
jgi:hypothetical protein